MSSGDKNEALLLLLAELQKPIFEGDVMRFANFCVISTKPTEPDDPQYVALSQKGRELFQAGDFKGAKAVYTEIIRTPNFKNAVAYSNRSLTNMKLNLPLGAFDDAVKSVAEHRATSIWNKTIHRLGEAALELGFFREAAFAFYKLGETQKFATVVDRFNEYLKKRQNPIVIDSSGRQIPSLMQIELNPPYLYREQLPPREPSVIEDVISRLIDKYQGITMLEVPGMGRGIFATKEFRKGDIILVEAPYLSVYAAGDHCDWCLANLSRRKRGSPVPRVVVCPECRLTRYCSEECHQAAWNSYHRVLCKHAAKVEAMRRQIAETAMSSSGRVHLQIIKLVGMTLQSNRWPCHTLSLPELQLLSVPKSFSGDATKLALWYYQYLQNAIEITDNPWFDLEWFEAVMSILSNNSHTIRFDSAGDDSEIMRKGGTGLYIMTSMFNHSCVPNASWCCGVEARDLGFPMSHMVVRAAKNIQKGEQIFISYIEVEGVPWEQRRIGLLHYGFQCQCPRCKREAKSGAGVELSFSPTNK